MEFLKGETEARYAWATAAQVARQERLMFKAGRRESLAEISRRITASLAASHASVFEAAAKTANHQPWREMLAQMDEHQRVQRAAFERLLKPAPAIDFVKLFPPTVDFKTMLEPAMDFSAKFGASVDFKAILGPSVDFSKMFKTVDFSEMFKTVDIKKAFELV